MEKERRDRAIQRLYATVLNYFILKDCVDENEIRAAIRNMIEVYKPKPHSLSSSESFVANYNDAAHRCAYLHKYAPLHTAMVAEMCQEVFLQNTKLFKGALSGNQRFRICSFGSGPGSDVIGVIEALSSHYGPFKTSVTLVDIMANWSSTFVYLAQELRNSDYGCLSQNFNRHYFQWSYLQCNMLESIYNANVEGAIRSADLLIMVKFISAAASLGTSSMLERVFGYLKPGSLVLYIDNAGGGFHQLINKQAQKLKLKTVYGPLKHILYKKDDLNIKRFGYTPCSETKVSVHMWKKLPETSTIQHGNNNRFAGKGNEKDLMKKQMKVATKSRIFSNSAITTGMSTQTQARCDRRFPISEATIPNNIPIPTNVSNPVTINSSVKGRNRTSNASVTNISTRRPAPARCDTQYPIIGAPISTNVSKTVTVPNQRQVNSNQRHPISGATIPTNVPTVSTNASTLQVDTLENHHVRPQVVTQPIRKNAMDVNYQRANDYPQSEWAERCCCIIL